MSEERTIAAEDAEAFNTLSHALRLANRAAFSYSMTPSRDDWERLAVRINAAQDVLFTRHAARGAKRS